MLKAILTAALVVSLATTLNAFEFCKGTYTGTGVSQPITSCTGITPTIVVTKARTTSQPAVVFMSGMGATVGWSDTSTSIVGITSLDAGGFTVGTHATVNANGVTYDYWAAANDASNDLAVGSYAGTAGAHNETISPAFQPIGCFVRAATTATAVVFVTSDMPVGQAMRNTAVATSGLLISTLNADGFGVLTDAQTNTAGVTFFYACFKAATNVEVFSYDGDGADNRNIPLTLTPGFAWIKNDTTSSPVYRFGDQSGDNSYKGNGAQGTNRIQNMGNSFVEVGTDGGANLLTSPVTPFYGIAMRSVIPGAPVARLRAGPIQLLQAKSELPVPMPPDPGGGPVTAKDRKFFELDSIWYQSPVGRPTLADNTNFINQLVADGPFFSIASGQSSVVVYRADADTPLVNLNPTNPNPNNPWNENLTGLPPWHMKVPMETHWPGGPDTASGGNTDWHAVVIGPPTGTNGDPTGSGISADDYKYYVWDFFGLRNDENAARADPVGNPRSGNFQMISVRRWNMRGVGLPPQPGGDGASYQRFGINPLLQGFIMHDAFVKAELYETSGGISGEPLNFVLGAFVKWVAYCPPSGFCGGPVVAFPHSSFGRIYPTDRSTLGNSERPLSTFPYALRGGEWMYITTSQDDIDNMATGVGWKAILRAIKNYGWISVDQTGNNGRGVYMESDSRNAELEAFGDPVDGDRTWRWTDHTFGTTPFFNGGTPGIPQSEMVIVDYLVPIYPPPVP